MSENGIIGSLGLDSFLKCFQKRYLALIIEQNYENERKRLESKGIIAKNRLSSDQVKKMSLNSLIYKRQLGHG